MPTELVTAARELIAAVRRPGRRTLVGIAGPPGAGKSTLATRVVASYPAGDAVYVPMDGFHLSNVELSRLGLADRKGAPETFDGAGFAQLVARLRRADELVYAPSYSRILHESIGGKIPVGPEVGLVVIEGNYLLLPVEPWSRARACFDLVIYLDAAPTVRVPGLVRRQRSRGLDEGAARDWVERSDEANARMVEASRPYADAVLVRFGNPR
jgi:pantothenate kinase